MFKRQCSLFLAIVSGILTLCVGFLQDVGIGTILFRCLISMIVFGLCGFLCGMFADKFLSRFEERPKPSTKGTRVDIVSVGEDHIPAEAMENAAEPKFSPFTPDNFDHVSANQANE